MEQPFLGFRIAEKKVCKSDRQTYRQQKWGRFMPLDTVNGQRMKLNDSLVLKVMLTNVSPEIQPQN